MDNQTKNVAVAYLKTVGLTPVDGITGQRRICTAFAERQGLTLKGVYLDHVGGTRGLGHGGLQDLLRDAAAGKFGVIVVESIDRLSRDNIEALRLLRCLSDLGIEVHQASSGRVEPDNVSLRGLMAETSRNDHRRRIRWGVRDAVRRGQVSGRRPYGYALLSGSRGGLRIDAGQAEVIREAFRLFGGGMATRDVAKALNDRPGADRTWMAGSVRKLLTTDLYDGRVVHGRTTRERDKATGRLRIIVCPDEQWIVVTAEHLRIVDAETWARVRDLLRRRRAGTSAVVRGLHERGTARTA